MDLVGTVFSAVLKIGVATEHRGMLDILLHGLCHHASVALALRVIAVEEVGIICVCLELAYRSIETVHTALVGQRHRRGCGILARVGIAQAVYRIRVWIFAVPVTACPFAKHTGVVSSLFEQLGYDIVGHQVRFLSNNGIVATTVKHRLVDANLIPIFSVATHISVTGMLPGHERRA